MFVECLLLLVVLNSAHLHRGHEDSTPARFLTSQGSAVLEMSVCSCFERIVLKNSPVGHVFRTIGSEQYPTPRMPRQFHFCEVYPIPCQFSSPPNSIVCLEHGVLIIAPYATMLRTGRSKPHCEIPHPIWFPTSMIGASKSLQGFAMCMSPVNIWFHPLSSYLLMVGRGALSAAILCLQLYQRWRCCNGGARGEG